MCCRDFTIRLCDTRWDKGTSHNNKCHPMPNIDLGLYVDKLSTSYMPAIVDNIGIVDCNVK